jgi:hypothetical protein
MDFFIGLTLLTPLGANAVIGGLVRQGYQVAMATEPMGQFLTLRVSNDTSEDDEDEDGEDEEGYGPEVLEGIHAALKKILYETETKYFSYVVFAGVVVAAWGEGNLKLVPDPPKGKTVFDHLEGE